MSDDWGTYFRRLTAGASGAEVARRLGVSDSKVSYWRRSERPPTVKEAIRVSREYGRSPLEGLVAAGHLEPDELSETITVEPLGLSAFTDVELAQEIALRARRGSIQP
ncbi:MULTISPECIES: helix-turn-helix transcriptional regulator [unclassified Microbacterium]|uniref:helix-turn-helix domain-containing protein n=1 Tax=unclassified Microbacterium TaxID=2609290 RepID=UPI002883329B|nr:MULTISPECIES: helix-turn-helix transcriptional regulator [unclassified Microbacterium]